MEMTGDKGALGPVDELQEWRSALGLAVIFFFFFLRENKKGKPKNQQKTP